MKNTAKNTMKNIKKQILTATTMATALLAGTATALLAGTATNLHAQTANNSWGVKNPLFDKVAGKLNLTANVGYVYNFASKWDGADIGTGKANGGVGYGARIGWTNTSGFGISGDYLGFTSKWSNGDKQYTNPYHVLTITPSYRFSFGQTKEWGLKVGLGVGMSLADVSWGEAKTAKGTASKIAGGAAYSTVLRLPGSNGACSAPSEFSDSLGGSFTVSAVTITIGASKCNDNANGVPADSGVSDTAMANAFIGADGQRLLGSIGAIGGVIPYGLWSGLATSTTNNTLAAQWLDLFVVGKTPGAGVTSFLQSVTLESVSAANTRISGGVAAVTINQAIFNLLNAKTKDALLIATGAKVADAPAPASGGSAKDDAGFVLAPEIALEYDNGLLHADLNARYIHGLANVKYDGQGSTSNQLQKSGPLAVFVGAGFGVNF